jgi:threonine dehydratase
LTVRATDDYHRSALPSVVPDRRVPLAAVRNAATAVYDAAVRTPLVHVDLRGHDTPLRELYLKLEVLQPIGSFKIRGAYNVLRQIPEPTRRGGVWTVSAGNAAQGVALAARLLGAPCAVLVMDTAPATKIQAIERLGARIVRASYDECWRAVMDHGSPRMTGHFVHPFDDDRFIAGNGTLALEIFEDLAHIDAIVAPLGGGGLLSGITSVVDGLSPSTRVFAAEPETAAPLAASFAVGRASFFDAWRSSFVDGAGGKSVLDTMWPLLQRVAGSIVVTLAETATAMRLVADRVHVIAEGAAACAVAAALGGGAGTGTVVAVVSGGNIDLTTFASLTHACPPSDTRS